MTQARIISKKPSYDVGQASSHLGAEAVTPAAIADSGQRYGDESYAQNLADLAPYRQGVW